MSLAAHSPLSPRLQLPDTTIQASRESGSSVSDQNLPVSCLHWHHLFSVFIDDLQTQVSGSGFFANAQNIFITGGILVSHFHMLHISSIMITMRYFFTSSISMIPVKIGSKLREKAWDGKIGRLEILAYTRLICVDRLMQRCVFFFWPCIQLKPNDSDTSNPITSSTVLVPGRDCQWEVAFLWLSKALRVRSTSYSSFSEDMINVKLELP